MKSEMKVNIAAGKIGLIVKPMNVTITSEFIDTADASSITLLYQTATRVAFTGMDFEIDWYKTNEGTPVVFESMGGAQAVVGGQLVTTLYPDKYTRTTSATIVGEAFNIACKARFCKIRVIPAAGDVTDLLTVDVVLIKTA